LQWWDERNVVSPRQDGHKRIYLPEEVVEISVIAELRRKGFSLQKIRRVLRFLQKDMGKRLNDALSAASDVHLLTDGKSIFLEEAPDRIIDVLKNARQPMFLVCVTDQVKRLDRHRRAQACPVRNRPARAQGPRGLTRFGISARHRSLVERQHEEADQHQPTAAYEYGLYLSTAAAA